MIDKIMPEEMTNFGNDVKAVFVLVVDQKNEKTVRELSKDLKQRYDEDLWGYFVYESNETLDGLGVVYTPALLVRIDEETGVTTYVVRLKAAEDVVDYVDSVRDGDFSGPFYEDDQAVANGAKLKSYLEEVLKLGKKD